MSDAINIRQSLGVEMIRARFLGDDLEIKGSYPLIQHIRDGKVIGEYSFDNGITNEGKNFLFDVMFNGTTQVGASSWCIGLIDNTSFSALGATDTMASHGGWIEFTGYTQSTRVAWGQTTASSQTITNGTPATFDISSSGTLQGIFVTSVNTKGGTTGKLWATGTFNAPVPVTSGDQIKITYAVAA